MEFSRLERAVMDQILRGEFEGAEIARKQYEHATVSERKYTKVGFYTSLEVPSEPDSNNYQDLINSINEKLFNSGN